VYGHLLAQNFFKQVTFITRLDQVRETSARIDKSKEKIFHEKYQSILRKAM
jgi:hypothetical protein